MLSQNIRSGSYPCIEQGYSEKIGCFGHCRSPKRQKFADGSPTRTREWPASLWKRPAGGILGCSKHGCHHPSHCRCSLGLAVASPTNLVLCRLRRILPRCVYCQFSNFRENEKTPA